MLEIRNVSKSFSGVSALDDVSFNVRNGEIHAVVGENGAGKSTLMKILSGVHRRYDGEVAMDGERLALSGPGEAQDHAIAMIHQELHLILGLTVAENFYLGRELRTPFGTLDKRRMAEATERSLAIVGLEASPSALVGSLRVGERQLVEIAKALSRDARLLILDEPTSALSEREIAGLISTLKGLESTGVTMIYISHKLGEVFALADTITVLRDGRHVATIEAADITEEELIRAMVGRDVGRRFRPADSSTGTKVLSIDSLSVKGGRGGRDLVHDVSLDVNAGEVVGLAGLMGAGRSEFLSAIFGAYEPGRVSGEIAIDGIPVEISTPRDALDHGVAFVTEDRKNLSLIPSHPVSHNITLPSLRRFQRMGLISRTDEAAAVRASVEQLGVKSASPNVAVETLSGGNQQKVVLAKCLMIEPRVLLLDEPTRGIDIGSKDEIYNLVTELSSRGTAVLLASSELPELLGLCNRVAVMAEGRLTALLNRSEASEETIMAAATARVVHRAARPTSEASLA